MLIADEKGLLGIDLRLEFKWSFIMRQARIRTNFISKATIHHSIGAPLIIELSLHSFFAQTGRISGLAPFEGAPLRKKWHAPLFGSGHKTA